MPNYIPKSSKSSKQNKYQITTQLPVRLKLQENKYKEKGNTENKSRIIYRRTWTRITATYHKKLCKQDESKVKYFKCWRKRKTSMWNSILVKLPITSAPTQKWNSSQTILARNIKRSNIGRRKKIWVRKSDLHKERQDIRERIKKAKTKCYTFLIYNWSKR